jgi:hypothetical protein
MVELKNMLPKVGGQEENKQMGGVAAKLEGSILGGKRRRKSRKSRRKSRKSRRKSRKSRRSRRR